MSSSLEAVKNEALSVFCSQQANRRRLKDTSAAERIQKLERLQRAFERRSDELKRALHADLRKPEAEVLLTEIYPITSEIRLARRRLRRWMRPMRVRAPLAFFGARCRVRYEPKGVVLILSPWNFPFMLAMGPLVSAIAAGNCIIVKPSELSPHTSAFIRSLVSDLFDPSEVAVLEGDHELARFLVKQPFDHIFFTGSRSVGKEVMATAASNLTSVTLELGGKSPVIIDASADLAEAATRVAWGKTLNAGQSCVAPDYALLPEPWQAPFVDLVRKSVERRYGPLERIDSNPDYCRIINHKHFLRIRRLLESALEGGAHVEAGGFLHEEDLFVSPTILTGVLPEAPLLQEEIFGPLLPIVRYRTREEAIAFVNSRPRPLALYIFARSRRAIEEILSGTRAGDTVVNDVVVHFGNVRLPFGGFNDSGIGKAHGFSGFKELSHERTVMEQPKWTLARLLYPPYTRIVKWLIRFTVRFL